MAIEITLVRHGETEANAAGIWQGTSDSPLSAAGRDQVNRLRRRLADQSYDLVISSDLGRARESSRAVGRAEVDERWRELHLGSWEGLTQTEIEDRDPDAVAALGSGEDIAFGGGERVSEMVERIVEAFEDLAGRLDDGGRALVVGHGGGLLTLISVLLGTDTRGKILRLTNTAVSTFRVSSDLKQLAVFNDSSHLPGAPIRADEGVTHVVAARHGETIANLERRWQGQTHGRLTDRGIDQARRLGEVFPHVDVLYSSPLARARETAQHISASRNVEVVEDAALRELGFGSWETKSAAEIAEADPVAWGRLVAGEDIVRGGSGESFTLVQQRMRAAVDRIAQAHHGKTVGLVSHGAATRALATSVLGLGFEQRRRMGVLGNTAMARFVYSDSGPALAAWNLSPHLAAES